MRRITLSTTATAAVLLAALAACSTSKPLPTSDKTRKPGKPAAASQLLTASTAFTKLSAKVPSAHLSDVVTAANDGNHLLGRPNQYTSKVDFTDSRIKASDVEYTKKGDVDRGGSIEVFADPTDAQTGRSTSRQSPSRCPRSPSTTTSKAPSSSASPTT
ncbi:hypothetical protein [Streptomyces sp. NBC_00557]|uniref:hypothetical protein n=1 Tax=Streptomyces sp. NBC_00557 TaxID=2975776 RepID=UPI002E81CF74|nr:hypothetical protein [Streptomyces sp. NBC_00557]WUC39592.1 hypothetical protein OG956_38135 [Streptomyces sp. NBC_00557]